MLKYLDFSLIKTKNCLRNVGKLEKIFFIEVEFSTWNKNTML